MGESELEWMAVTSGGMNVCHSTFLVSLGGGGGKKQPHAACEEGTLAGATRVPMHTKMFRAVSQDTWLRHHLLPTSKKPDFKYNSNRTENRVKFLIEE